MVVLDSSALLALLRRERGAAVVRRMLRQERGACCIHGANLCELFQRIARERGQATALRAVQLFLRAGVIFREDMDIAFWQDAGSVIAQVRGAGMSLALGDSFGVALARRLTCEFVTADHGEFDPLLPLALCRIRFIR